jgi:hypothetical protein
MNEDVRKDLRRIVVKEGHRALDDPRRVENLLNDLHPPPCLETTAIVQALKAGAARRLLPVATGGVLAPARAGLVKRLREEFGLMEEPAQWAVDVVEDILRHTPAGPPGQQPAPGSEQRDAILRDLANPATATFGRWVDGLLAGVPPTHPLLAKARSYGDPWSARPQPAGCHNAPEPQPANPRHEVPSPPPPAPTPSDADQVRNAYRATVVTGNAESVARAWMTLRAVDQAGVTRDERSTGEAAVREWGELLVEEAEGSR